MRAPTDLSSRRPRPGRGRVWLVALVSILFLLLISLRGIAGFYTDFLWFDSLGLSKVWRGVLGAKVALSIVFCVVFFVILFLNLTIADRLAPPFRPAGPEEELVERYRDFVGNRGRLVRVAISALFALIAGLGTSAQWNSWILFNNKVSFGREDPLFHKDIGFYVFQLPFLKFLVDWAFASMVIILIVTAVAHYLNGGIRVQVPASQRVTPQVKAHLSVLLGVLALLKAAGYWFQRYELTFSSRGVVDGASYTDVKAQLPALQLLVIISVAAFVLFLVNIRLRGWILPIIAVGLWGFTSIVVGAAYPAFIQKFRVEPNQSVRERPYIERNIAATREALGLSKVTVKRFDYNENLNQAGVVENAPTIRNVRLWDPKILQETYKQLQEIRSFYQFNDVDIDRYRVQDKTTQIVLSARNLDTDQVPNSWENRHLNFTHGYGAVMSPANAVTKDGLPDFLLKDLPPESPDKDFALKEPAIYFGEDLSGYAIVGTKRAEIDYQNAEGKTVRRNYAGNGGVKMSSIVRRFAFALRFGNINPLISNFITPSSKAIYIRDIRERVRKAAPFLRYDGDPYPLVLNGRVSWIQDAYTVSSRYPYAEKALNGRVQETSGLTSRFNYVRNSVKVQIDAYDGTMKYWITDKTDPIVKAYQQAFPQLFSDGEKMPAQLRAHLRYPEDLFRVQTDMWATYHISDPDGFFDKGDAWDVAADPGSQVPVAPVTASTPTSVARQNSVPREDRPRMDPYYLLMRLPDAADEDFLILQPFTPARRDLLSAFMVAKSDPKDFGKIEVFEMPREETVPGPTQVDAKINQDVAISQQLTLLGQQGGGSQVRAGNLLVIPIERSLLYIRPLYVQAESTKLPELKKVIVVFGDRAVMRDTLREALTEIFGQAPETQEQQGGQTPTTPLPGGQPGANPAVGSLLDQAVAAYGRAQTALKNGDLAGYQREVNEMNRLVDQARKEQSGSSNPTTTTTAPASA